MSFFKSHSTRTLAAVGLAMGLVVSTASAQQTGSIGDQTEPAQQEQLSPAELTRKASYIIGRQIQQDFSRDGVEIDLASLIQGIQDGAAGKESPIPPEEVQSVMQAFSRAVMAQRQQQMQKIADDNLAEANEFLKKNSLEEGVKQLETGVQYKVMKEGTGASPAESDEVTVHYTGMFIDGTKFDSSVDRGMPATFPLDGVIPGWTKTLPRMKVGSKWRLYIPPKMAYGEAGKGSIPPNKLLIFDIELLEIK